MKGNEGKELFPLPPPPPPRKEGKKEGEGAIAAVDGKLFFSFLF